MAIRAWEVRASRRPRGAVWLRSENVGPWHPSLVSLVVTSAYMLVSDVDVPAWPSVAICLALIGRSTFWTCRPGAGRRLNKAGCGRWLMRQSGVTSSLTHDSRVGTSRHVGLALLALATGGFAIGTTEFVTMGLLPQIADGVHIDIPTAGHIVSAYAIGVVVGAPLIAALGARTGRKRLLLGLMTVFVLGNVLSAVANSVANSYEL